MAVSLERGVFSAFVGVGGAGAVVMWPAQWWIGAGLMALAVLILLWGVRINGKHVWQRWWQRETFIPAAAQQPEPNPILFAGFIEARHTPIENHTAIRLVVRNRSDQNLTGLVARVIRAEPPLDGMGGATHVPLTLATTTRLDRLRNHGERLPAQPFNLNAGIEKHIEVVWLGTDATIEGHITHEGGEATFLFLKRQELWVEVSGAGPPIVAVVRIDEDDPETGRWTVTLIPEAVGGAHGQGSVGQKP